jgi:hypothetical protein
MAVPVKTELSPEIHEKMVACAQAVSRFLERVWKARMSAAIGDTESAYKHLEALHLTKGGIFQTVGGKIEIVENYCRLDLSDIRKSVETLLKSIRRGLSPLRIQERISDIEARLYSHLLEVHPKRYRPCPPMDVEGWLQCLRERTEGVLKEETR